MAEVRTPAHIAPYVKALGIDGAVTVFLKLGGSQIYLARRSNKRTIAAEAIGVEAVARLAAVLGAGYFKVPLARQWVAEVLRVQGKSDNEIARIVRADIATVRRWLPSRSSGEQLTLPL